MISALKNFDGVVAAGLLARAALSAPYAGEDWSPEEAGIRASIISEARDHLGLKPDDYAEASIEKIVEFLDAEADKLIAAPDETAALNRLAQRGDLPSDLYSVTINPNMEKVYKKGIDLESKLVRATVQSPHVEQHFGAGSSSEPELVSLFARHFRTTWPLRNFIELVAGSRKGTQLDVNQAWRIYPARIDLGGLSRPIDWLQKFTETYGADIDVNGKIGKFFYLPEVSSATQKMVEAKGRSELLISDFTTWRNGKEVATLITSIDILKYRKTLEDLAVRESDILDLAEI